MILLVKIGILSFIDKKHVRKHQKTKGCCNFREVELLGYL